ncbi:MAG: DUF2807 domain-containing protein [Candidatus Sericytochromatia bacterium]|nr:DUF2807 domain-containing protein [Candidatus Sericytochromatia bacterium]
MIIKKSIFILSTLCLNLFLSASFFEVQVNGDGLLKKEIRSVGDFNKINASGVLNIKIICQAKKSLEIESDTNILALLKTSVNNKTLTIGSDKSLKPINQINITIFTPDINKIELSGSSQLDIKHIKNSSFVALVNGASNLNASGETKNVELKLQGAGYIDTKKLKAKKVKVTLSGASMVDIFAQDELSANISGFGKINYYGNPQKITQNISGMGMISDRSSPSDKKKNLNIDHRFK